MRCCSFYIENYVSLPPTFQKVFIQYDRGMIVIRMAVDANPIVMYFYFFILIRLTCLYSSLLLVYW